MLARFFKKSEPVSFISLLLILLFLVVISFFTPPPISKNLFFFLQIISVFVLFAFMTFLAGFIIDRNHLTPANYYAIVLFVLFLGLFPAVFSISKISFSHLFVLFAARRLYSLRSKRERLFKLFDSGFFIGISFLIYPQSVLYLFLVYSSFLIYQKIIDKNLFIPLLGFVTPVFIYFAYCFVFGNETTFFYFSELHFDFDTLKIAPFDFLIPFSILILLMLWSLFRILTKIYVFDGDDKNSIKLITIHLTISIIILLSNNLKIEETVQYLFFPIAVLVGNLFYLIRKYWIKDFVLYSLLLFVFIWPFVQKYFI